ncbi:hypothetical protein BDDG_02498 [Blastomyces dermatitidis ATCC 18188]|uniref:Uncharacterized protein n=1 Tax=Ajellomyces dermatitidis (strain ATCC 18188 / CBS 674.68) TaxID=653446 RepID=F2T8J4_AJEDA|nr:hypothetical protein BDDG_02498 [Blastomyces dermatitidis ATCC 18188]
MSSQKVPDTVVSESPADENTDNPAGNDHSGESNLVNDAQSSSQSDQSKTDNSSDQSSQPRRGLLDGVSIVFCSSRVGLSGGMIPRHYTHATPNLSAGTPPNVQVCPGRAVVTPTTSATSATTTTTTSHGEATEEDTPQ